MTSTTTKEFPYLRDLLKANQTWAAKVTEADKNFFPKSADGQTPKILWIGCADSRVPESVVLARRPGDVFVHRNIANQFHKNDDSAISVLTYAVDHLGVEHVIVVGHSNCGGAAAALDASSQPASSIKNKCECTEISSLHDKSAHDIPLIRWLTPLTDLATSLRISTVPRKEALQTLVDESVRRQVENVCGSEVIQGVWARFREQGQQGGEEQDGDGVPKKVKEVWVHGWVYELETGLLHDLHVSKGPLHPN